MVPFVIIFVCNDFFIYINNSSLLFIWYPLFDLFMICFIIHFFFWGGGILFWYVIIIIIIVVIVFIVIYQLSTRLNSNAVPLATESHRIKWSIHFISYCYLKITIFSLKAIAKLLHNNNVISMS